MSYIDTYQAKENLEEAIKKALPPEAAEAVTITLLAYIERMFDAHEARYYHNRTPDY